jgi:hypothetical protein
MWLGSESGSNRNIEDLICRHSPELIIERLLDCKRKHLGTLAQVQHVDSAESYSMVKAVASLA